MVGKMRIVKQRNPSFFKVLLDDFKTELRIPELSVGAFGSNKSVILTNLTAENRSWVVSINRTCDGGLCFQGNRWLDFINDNAIKKGDFLVFNFVGNARLRVLAFGKTSCLKTPKATKGPADKPQASQFKVRFARFNLFGLFVPKEFVVETGMRNRKRVVVKDWNGREWPVKVTHLSNGGLRLGDGWADFVKRNDLRVGINCIFQSLLPAADDNVFVLLAYPCDITLDSPGPQLATCRCTT